MKSMKKMIDAGETEYTIPGEPPSPLTTREGASRSVHFSFTIPSDKSINRSIGRGRGSLYELKRDPGRRLGDEAGEES